MKLQCCRRAGGVSSRRLEWIGIRAHLVGTTKTRPKALPLPARHERGEGRGEGFVYSFDVVPGPSFVVRLVVPAKCARVVLGASLELAIWSLELFNGS